MFNRTENDDDFKKKRAQFSVNIRRQNREELLNKRRAQVQPNGEDCSEKSHENKIMDSRFYNEILGYYNQQYSEEEVQKYFVTLQNGDIMSRMQALIALRSVSDSDKSELIAKLKKMGIASILVGLAQQDEYPQLRYEAIWMMGNITYSDGICQELVKFGVIPITLKLLTLNNEHLNDNLLSIVGNLTVEDPKFRDVILTAGGLQVTFKVLASYTKQQTLQNSVWVITNLCRGSPPPKYTLIESSIPVLCKALQNPELQNLNKVSTQKVVSDVLWTLNNMTDNSKQRVDRLAQTGIVPLIFNYCRHQHSQISYPSFKILGNFSNLTEVQTDMLLQTGILDLCLYLLNTSKKSLKKQASFVLSNIAAGNFHQVNQLISRLDILNKLQELFKIDEDDVKIQICWVYASLGHAGKKGDIMKLIQHYDIVRSFVNLLDSSNNDLLENALKALMKLMQLGNKALVGGNNLVLLKFIQYNGIEKLQKIQQNESKSVYKAAVGIITKFFEAEAN